MTVEIESHPRAKGRRRGRSKTLLHATWTPTELAELLAMANLPPALTTLTGQHSHPHLFAAAWVVDEVAVTSSFGGIEEVGEGLTTGTVISFAANAHPRLDTA